MVSGLVWLVDEEDELMVNRAGLWGLPVGYSQKSGLVQRRCSSNRDQGHVLAGIGSRRRQTSVPQMPEW